MRLHFEAISVNQAGAVALASSSLTGRLWTGAISVFENSTDATSVDKAVSRCHCEASLSDIRWVSANVVLVSSDSGALELWQVTESCQDLQFLSMVYEHDGPVRCVAVNRQEQPDVVLSGSDDCTIAMWRLDGGFPIAERRFKVSTRPVTGISCAPASDERVFASCARDDRALLWDLRVEQPALAMPSTSSAICPSLSSDNQLALGCETGMVEVRDIRQPDTALFTYAGHNAAVTRVSFSPHTPSLLASCGEDGRVHVQSLAEKSTCLHREAHEDFSRGLAWHSQTSFLSCGLDGQVLVHDLC